MLAQARGDAVDAEPADLHPELERAEAAAELDAVLVEVVHAAGVGRAQVLGDEAEGVAERLRAAEQEKRRVERREHPLVRVDDDRIRALPAAKQRAHLRARSRRSRRRRRRRAATAFRCGRSSAIAAHGSTLVEDVVPSVATTQNGVHPAARSSTIASASASARIAIVVIDGDAAYAGAPDAGDDRRLLDRGVRLRRRVHPEASELRAAREALVARVEPGTAWRAATIDSSDEIDAVSVSMPSNASGRPSICRSHETTTSSSSVDDGALRQSMTFEFNAGGEPLARGCRGPRRRSGSRP